MYTKSVFTEKRTKVGNIRCSIFLEFSSDRAICKDHMKSRHNLQKSTRFEMGVKIRRTLFTVLNENFRSLVQFKLKRSGSINSVHRVYKCCFERAKCKFRFSLTEYFVKDPLRGLCRLPVSIEVLFTELLLY